MRRQSPWRTTRAPAGPAGDLFKRVLHNIFHDFAQCLSRGGPGLEGAKFGARAAAAGQDIAAILKDALGEERVCDELWERRLYDHDVAPTLSAIELFYGTIPDVVVRPKDAAQVAEVLRLANRHRFPVVPRGAATWGLGGAVPTRKGVVLDLTSLDSIVDIVAEKGLVLASAGATWQKAIDAARRKGLHIGTYPSSFPAATVGGWIAVGGVGIGTLGHGRIHENLASLQVVLPQGSIEECPPAKGAGGLPLETFVGTEGVLGVVTRAGICARSLPERTLPLSFTFPALADAAAFLGRLPRELSPTHVMFADRANFEWLEAAGISTGVRTALVTVVLEGEAARVESEAKRVEALARSTGGGCAPSEVAQRQWRERSREYRMRRAGTGSLPGQVLLPLGRFREAVERTYALLRQYRLNAAMIGTLADRDTFMLMPYYLIDERRQARTLAAMTFNYYLAELALSLGGRPAGLGMYLPLLLQKDRGAAGARRLLEMKERLDPKGVLNPGKLLLSNGRSGRRISPSLSVLAMRMGRMLSSKMAKESFPKSGHREG